MVSGTCEGGGWNSGALDDGAASGHRPQADDRLELPPIGVILRDGEVPIDAFMAQVVAHLRSEGIGCRVR